MKIKKRGEGSRLKWLIPWKSFNEHIYTQLELGRRRPSPARRSTATILFVLIVWKTSNVLNDGRYATREGVAVLRELLSLCMCGA
jgi:hypothetical protein